MWNSHHTANSYDLNIKKYYIMPNRTKGVVHLFAVPRMIDPYRDYTYIYCMLINPWTYSILKSVTTSNVKKKPLYIKISTGSGWTV